MLVEVRHLLSFASALTLSLLCAAAFAEPGAEQPAERPADRLAAARRQYTEGITLESAGDHAGALKVFVVVAEVARTPRVLFHIARCNKQLGRWTTALGQYREAIDLARAEGGSDDLPEIVGEHDELAAAIPKLTITVTGGAAARVVVDGVEVGSMLLGKPMTLDPGAHTITARLAEDQRERVIDLAPGAQQQVAFDFSAPAEAPPPPISPPADDVAVDPAAEPSHALAYVSLAAGGAFVVAGAVLLGLRQHEVGKLDDACLDRRCPTDMESVADRGQAFHISSIVGFAVGGAGLALGTVLLLAADDDGATVGLHLSPGAAKLRLRF